MPKKGIISRFRKLLPGNRGRAEQLGAPYQGGVVLSTPHVPPPPGETYYSYQSSNDEGYEPKPKAIPLPRAPVRPLVPPKHFTPVKSIQTWAQYYSLHKTRLDQLARNRTSSPYPVDYQLAKMISLWQGDITKLEVDIIVNETNRSILGDPLRAKYIISTTPHSTNYTNEELRLSCLRRLRMMVDLGQKTIAFPCTQSTIYGSNYNHIEIVLKTIRTFLKEFKHSVDRVLLCVGSNDQLRIHEKLMLKYFPMTVSHTH